MADELEDWPVVTDDSGTLTDGTVWNRAISDAYRASIEDWVVGPVNPTVKAGEIIDEVVEARGDAASLEERLQVAMDADGHVYQVLYPTNTIFGLTATGTMPVTIPSAQTTTAAGNTLAVKKTFSSYTPQVSFDGDLIHIRAAGLFANNANTKTIRVEIGATTVSVIVNSSGVAGNIWTLDVTIYRISSTSAGISGVITFNAATGAAPTVQHINNPTAYAENFGLLPVIALTGQATATDDIICHWATIQVQPL